MNVFSVTGTIRSFGQSQFNLARHQYAYVEIVESNGRRVSVQNVLVGNRVGTVIDPSTQGEFFFDKFLFMFVPIVQLWGVKTHDGLVGYSRNVRAAVTAWHIIMGLLMTPLLGLGLPFVVLGLLQLLKLIGTAGAREQLFYGHDEAEARRLRQQQAVRI